MSDDGNGDPGRGSGRGSGREEDQKRLNRNLNELLQELRVSQAGVQILFGFLLSIAFTDRYASAGTAVRVIHLVTVMFAAGAVASFTAPAAWHRVLFRQGRRREIVESGDKLALAGLALLSVAMTGTIVVLAAVVAGAGIATLLGVISAATFGVLWFIVPQRYRRTPHAEPDDTPGDESAAPDQLG